VTLLYCLYYFLLQPISGQEAVLGIFPDEACRADSELGEECSKFPASTLDIPSDVQFTKLPYFNCKEGSQAFVYMQNQNDLKGDTFTGTAEFKVTFNGDETSVRSVNIVDAKRRMEINWISGSLTTKDDDCPTKISFDATVPDHETEEETVVTGQGELSVQFAEESWPNILQFQLNRANPRLHMAWNREPPNPQKAGASSVCQTFEGKRCVFPFMHEGVKHHVCQKRQAEGLLRSWCATEVDQNLNVISYGICNTALCPVTKAANCIAPPRTTIEAVEITTEAVETSTEAIETTTEAVETTTEAIETTFINEGDL